jgi:membrane-associated phospholipid phosphatase
MVPERGVAVAVTGSATAAAPVRRSRLQAVDLLLLGYLGVISLVALERAPRNPGCWWLLGAHLLFGILLLLVTRPGLGKVGRILRELYPLLLLIGLYGELDVLSGINGPPVHDSTIQRWELALFGMQVSRVWWQELPSRFWSTILHGAYFSYYLIVSIPAFYFAWRGRLGNLREFVLTVMITFVICYLAFVFYPVAGPYYVFPHPSGWFTDNGPARLVYAILAAGSSYGAAFPSSHVAASAAATISAWRGSRTLGAALVLPTVLLGIGVVYCQMHYGVDALAGLGLGIVVAGATGLRVKSEG